MRGICPFVCICCAIVSVGCGGGNAGSGAQTGLATVQEKVGSHSMTLEIADTEAKRETGLMYRTSMPNDHGMIFVFPDSQVRQFYMANTKIPLDIAFIGADDTVVAVRSMQPMDLRITSSERPAKYAIEMNLGEAATIGLNEGDHVDLSNVPGTNK